MIPCLFIKAKRRIVLLYSCSKALLNIYLSVFCVAVTCVAIPHVADGKLHKMCMFHATRKRGPQKHVTDMHYGFLMAPHVDTFVKMKL